eukprot:1793315-Amphidinium_carterae.1
MPGPLPRRLDHPGLGSTDHAQTPFYKAQTAPAMPDRRHHPPTPGPPPTPPHAQTHAARTTRGEGPTLLLNNS